jgi:hypothetical protein
MHKFDSESSSPSSACFVVRHGGLLAGMEKGIMTDAAITEGMSPGHSPLLHPEAAKAQSGKPFL